MLRKNLLLTILATATFLTLPLAFVGAPVAFRYISDLKDPIEKIKGGSFEAMHLATEVFDRDGRKVGEFNTEKRYFVKINDIPPHVRQAFLSAEDKDFYSHWGLSPLAILRSFIANVRGMTIRQGASTITQQVARMWFLTPERKFERKIKEAILSVMIERHFSKDEILELYLNKIYLGNHSYGIEAAARNYFRKNTSELSIGEAAMLAGLPKSPSRYAPNKNRALAGERQAFVLGRMVEDGIISDKDAEDWKKFRIPVAKKPESHFDKAPYFVSAVREELRSRFEMEKLPESGLKITTTLDGDLQRTADEQLETMLGKIRKHAINDFKHKAKIEGSLISIDPTTGAVLAIQGGSDFQSSQFNRAIYSRRQVGSLFLPIYVSLALERGYTVDSLVGDDPIGGKRYKRNSGRKSLYDLVKGASATEGAPLYVALGSGSVREYAEQMGFRFEKEDLSLALGFGEASPAELTRAYSAFANGGHSVQPYLIQKIEDADGKLLYQAQESGSDLDQGARVMSDQSAFMMYHLMRDAVRSGHADMASGVSSLAAGVSSATEDLHNSWFVGILPEVVTTVWVGAERGRTRLGQDPASVADISEMVWKEFMTAAPSHYRDGQRKIMLPEGISFSRVPSADGTVLSLPFLTGREPRRSSKTF